MVDDYNLVNFVSCTGQHQPLPESGIATGASKCALDSSHITSGLEGNGQNLMAAGDYRSILCCVKSLNNTIC